VHLRKIHLWKIRHQQWGEASPIPLAKLSGLIGPHCQPCSQIGKGWVGNPLRTLTQENHLPRLVLLNLALAYGNSLETFIAARLNGRNSDLFSGQ